MLVNSFFETKVDQLFEVLNRLSSLFEDAGIKYQLIGGMATYMHVNRIDPMGARLTRDVDVCVRRQDLKKIADFANKHGFHFHHAAGIDTLLDLEDPKAHSAVHLIFAGDLVRPNELAPVPEIDQPDRGEIELRVLPGRFAQRIEHALPHGGPGGAGDQIRIRGRDRLVQQPLEMDDETEVFS